MPHPQNPYESYMVEASAGSGKTFQLSKRFLNLVASGAKPAHILTITFTVKAANEMRARIIVEATRLLDDESAQKAFDMTMQGFFQNAQTYWRQQGIELPHPLCAKDVGASILASTQLLQISTIDALFKDWVSKFPWESLGEAASKADSSKADSEAGGNRAETSTQPLAHFGMLEPMDLEDLNRKAWLRLFTKKEARTLLQQAWDCLKIADSERGPLSIEGRIYELFRLRTYLWHAEQALEASAYCPHLPSSSLENAQHSNLQAIIQELQDPLLALARTTKRASEMGEAIRKGDGPALIDLKLLTKNYEVHGGTIRGKNRDLLAESILEVEEVLRSYLDRLSLQRLDLIGSVCYKLYELWMQERERLKRQQNCVEFDDLSIASHRLLHGPTGAGVLWLIQKSIQHLLLDEFQDTSFLQWQVFACLAEELLSGKGSWNEQGSMPTVFIVGDAKQSIYGFREADPEVMNHARAFLTKFQKTSLPLSDSYRSAQVVLDFVNRVFRARDPNFALHQTARDSENKPFIPDCGKVVVHDLFTADAATEQGEELAGLGEKQSLSSVEREAAFVARYLRQAVNDKTSHPVYSKSRKAFRPLELRDCCILYRSATHASAFAKALRQEGLAYRREDQRGFFARCEIQDMMAFLEALLHPDDGLALCSVLKSPIFAFADPDMAALLETAQGPAQPEGEVAAQSLGLRLRASLRTSLTVEHASVLRSLEELQAKAALALPHQLLTELYSKLHVLEKYQQAFLGVEGKVAKKNLIKLLEVCTRLEDDGYVSLAQCLERLQILAQKSELASASFQSNVVSLMTIHKAKGLEFPLVAVVGTGELWHKDDRYWLKRSGQGVAFIGTKSQQPQRHPDFLSLLHKQQEEGEAESLRLLYVALTRASQHLLITGHKPHIFKKDAFLPSLVALAQDSASPWDTPVCQGQQGQAWYWQGQRQNPALVAPPANSSANPHAAPAGIATPTQPLALPYELQIVQPHMQGEKQLVQNAKIPPKLEAAIGAFVHAGLGANATEQTWQAPRAWLNLVVPIAKKERTYPLRLLPELELTARKALQENLVSSAWQALLAPAQVRKAKLPIVQLSREHLLRGQIDLYLEGEQRVVLVAFKSVLVDALAQDQDLFRFCQEQGYQQVLTTYCRAIQELKPQHEITAGVWLSKAAKMVWVVGAPP